jgi:hypothetical protein
LGELLDGRGGLAEVDQDERLLGDRVCEQQRRACLTGSGFGAFVVVPCLADGVAVEGFPAGQCGRFGEDAGELLALAVWGAVGE